MTLWNSNENMIEFLKDQEVSTVTLSQGRYISRVVELAARFPNEVVILAYPENNGGYLYARIPTKWIRINPTMILSDEERKRRSDLASSIYKARNGSKIDSESIDEEIYLEDDESENRAVKPEDV